MTLVLAEAEENINNVVVRTTKSGSNMKEVIMWSN